MKNDLIDNKQTYIGTHIDQEHFELASQAHFLSLKKTLALSYRSRKSNRSHVW